VLNFGTRWRTWHPHEVLPVTTRQEASYRCSCLDSAEGRQISWPATQLNPVHRRFVTMLTELSRLRKRRRGGAGGDGGSSKRLSP
jgi:hypothetical protein